MATTLTVGDYIRVRVWTRVLAESQAAVNSLWYIVAAVGGTPATDLDVATQLDTSIAPGYKPLLSADAEYRGVQAQITQVVPPYRAKNAVQESNSHAGVGTGGTSLLPSQTCGLGRFATDLAGRQARGRMYYAFPSQASDTGLGVPNTTYIAALASLTGFFAAGVAISVTGRTATLLRVLIHQPNKAGVTLPPSPVQSSSVSSLWATQRKRGNFGRHNDSPI